MATNRVVTFLVALLFSSVFAFAETVENPAGSLKGTTELGFWFGGGRGLNGSTKDTELFITGVRGGKILTDVHGNGFMRGNLEYLLEAIPIFLVFQNGTTAGFDFTPFLMKWNFLNSERRPTMFFEWGAGTLVTSSQVPEGTSRFNFTPQAGFGFYLSSHHKRAATLEFKYIHISNGGLETPNPGINTFHILLGYHWLH
jgi:lipid A 3-O-deacylase